MAPLLLHLPGMAADMETKSVGKEVDLGLHESIHRWYLTSAILVVWPVHSQDGPVSQVLDLLCFSTLNVSLLFLCCRKVLKEISVSEINPNETVQATLEAQLLSTLDHPAIVKFYASFVERENFCIITEYCEVRSSFLSFQKFNKSWVTVKCPCKVTLQSISEQATSCSWNSGSSEE